MRTSGDGNTEAVRVLLVEDHAVLRQALRLLLETFPDITVVGEAGDGREGLRLVEKLRPRVVILDIVMPEMNGLEVARQVARRCPDTRILILSAAGTRELVVEALRAGASGFVIKRADTDELVLAINLIAKGHHYFSDDLAQSFDGSELIHESKLPGSDNPMERLTEREREVVQLLAEGHTTRGIAGRLVLSEKTVDGHKSRAMAKLGIQNRAALVKVAIRHGLISVE
ncbi:MAG TPA: response regulator transcription factor [Tepidiformaceae bacterium]